MSMVYEGVRKGGREAGRQSWRCMIVVEGQVGRQTVQGGW